MELWTYNLWPNTLQKTYPLFSPRLLVLPTSALFLWKLGIFRKCSTNFQDCITWLLNTIYEYLKRFYLKNRLNFSYLELFYSHTHECYFFRSRNDDMVMTSWWQNDDTVMTSKAKNLFVVLFLLLKIIIWPVLNVIACSKLVLFHFLFFKDFARKLGFFKIGFRSWDRKWRTEVTTALKVLQIMQNR